MPSVLADSNILLRIAQPSHVHHSVVLAVLDKLLLEDADLCIVTQNLVEFWAVATRPVANHGLGMSPANAMDEMRNLRSIFHLLDGAAGIADAWEKLVASQHVSGKQAHDAHLAAAMAVYGVNHVLTFNGDDFKRYARIVVLHPAQV